MAEEIEAEKKNFNKIFGDFWFLVPQYQRSYVWDNDRINELLDDLWYAHDNKPESEYFLGSLVLKKTKQDYYTEYEVLDGQQRLTTLFVVIAVIRDLTTDEKLKEACEQWLQERGNQFMGIPPRQRIVYTIREEVTPFLKDHILTNGGTQNTEELKRHQQTKNVSVKNLSNAVLTISKFFSEKAEKEIKAFSTYLSQKPVFIYVSTDQMEDAFRMFTILNNRGLPLTNADILKSNNVGAIEDENEQRAYAQNWEKLEGDLGEDFDRFLSFVRTVYVKEKARLNLLEEFEENIYKKSLLSKGKETIDYLLKTKDNYDSLVRSVSDSSLSNDFKNLVTVMEAALPSGDWIPPLLAYYEKFDDDKLEDFLFRLEYKFSSDWILKLTPSDRIKNMNQIIKNIKDSNTAEDLLSNKWLFEVDTPALKEALSQPIFGQRHTRYVLLKYEYKIGDDTVHLSGFNNLSVEHILPKNPKEESHWLEVFSEEQREYWTDRIGNLIPISKRRNSQLSNLDFNEKMSRYLKDRLNPFPSGKVLLSKTDWTPEELEERQNDMVYRLTQKP